MLKICAALLGLLVLTSCAHYIESGDMDPATARALAGAMSR